MKKFILAIVIILFLQIPTFASEIETPDELEVQLEEVKNQISQITLEEETIKSEIAKLKESYDIAFENYTQKIQSLCSVSCAVSTSVIYDLNTKTTVMQLITSEDMDNPNYIQGLIDGKNDELKLLYFQKESYQQLKSQIQSSIDDYSEKYETTFTPIWPVPGFGENWVTNVFGNGHNGFDIAAYQGTDIVAVQSGMVISADYHWSWGNNVLIYHNEEYTTRYAHMYEIYVEDGDYVTQGQVIGTVGSTGNSTGNHLHYEVYYDGTRVDPYQFFSD